MFCLNRYSHSTPMAQMTARTSVYLRKARTSVARMPVLAMTKSETYAISSGSCLIEPSSSSVRLSSRAPRTTLMKATVTKAPTPAWIHVSFIRGASRPPTRSPTAHVRTTNGSTSRSNLRSIGSWKVSSMSLNGTIQSTARKPANVHGSSRVVCGQSSPTRPGVRGSRISGCPSRRRVSSVRPNHVSPAVTRKVTSATAPGMPPLTTAPWVGPSVRSRTRSLAASDSESAMSPR